MLTFLKKIFLNTEGSLRSGWRFLISVIVFLVSIILAAVVTSAIANRHSEILFESINRPLGLGLVLMGFVLMLKWLDRVEQGPLEAQGLGTRGPWLRQLTFGLGLGFGMIALAVAAIKILGSYQMTFEPSMKLFPKFLAIVWIVATAAMLEEVCFRGYPFQRLIEGIGTWGATVLLSGLFGLVHLGNPHVTVWSFLNTVLVGGLLALAYIQTRSLWLPFGIHAAWNFTLESVFGLPVSGINLFIVFVRGNAQGPELLTGGDYGIEASLTGAIVMLLGFAVLIFIGPKFKPMLA